MRIVQVYNYRNNFLTRSFILKFLFKKKKICRVMRKNEQFTSFPQTQRRKLFPVLFTYSPNYNSKEFCTKLFLTDPADIRRCQHRA